MYRTVKIRKISNGYLTTTYAKSHGYETHCKDFDELCFWLKENLEVLEYKIKRKVNVRQPSG